jgi:hypothetical protein
MRREKSRVSFLMCPFCVRGLVSNSTTRVLIDRKRRDRDETAEARSLSIFGRQVGRAATEFDMIKQRALA